MKNTANPEAAAPHCAREYVFPLVLGLIVVAAGSLPYLYGYAHAPAGERFMGFVGRGTPGANGYLMFAKQAQEGQHLMANKMTPEPLPRTYFNLEWWLFGKAARWSGVSLMAIFHAGRVLTVFAFLCAAYYLAALCLDSVFKRRLAVVLICLGSGFGWVLWSLNFCLDTHLILSRDLRGICVPGYLVNKPHFIRAGIFAALAFAFILAGERSGKRRYFVYSGVAALAHSCIRPYHIPETYLVYMLYPALLCLREGRWSWLRFKNYLLAGAVHLPAVFYFAYLAYADTLGMSGWERKPGFLIEYVFWLGWPFAVCCAAMPWLLRLRDRSDATVLLVLWLLAAWLICNAYPYWRAGQEAAFYAFHIAPPILVLLGPLAWIYQWLQQHPRLLDRLRLSARAPYGRTAAAAVLVLASMPSTMLVYADMFSSLRSESGEWTYYLSEDYCSALQWLASQAGPDDVVLASPRVSQFVPRLARSKVVTGHDMLTADYEQKNRWVARFFAADADETFRRDLTRRLGVRYVVYGAMERAMGAARLEESAWLSQVFRCGDVVVYAVIL